MLVRADSFDRKSLSASDEPVVTQTLPSYQDTAQVQPTSHFDQGQLILPANRQESYGSIPESVRRARATRHAQHRFCKAICIGLLVWILVCISVSTFASMVQYPTEYPSWSSSFLTLPEIQMADCIKATDFDPTGVLGELKKTFSISLDNDYESIVLLSRGIINQGHAIVTRTVMDNESSDAIVDVRILRNENRADLLRHLTVCSIIRGTEGRRGVGVFGANNLQGWPGWLLKSLDDIPSVVITLRLPANQQYIKQLETDLPNFSQTFQLSSDLNDNKTIAFGQLDVSGTNSIIKADSLHFSSGSIETTNAFVHIENVQCDKCSVKTTNGGVHGTYNASHSLILRTTNAPIDVTVFLGDANAEGRNHSSEISTTNQKLKADITLLGQESSSSAARYELRTSTKNSPLHLTIPSMPLYSTLDSASSTTNSPAYVTAPNEFEGTFSLSTTNAVTQVNGLNREDPTRNHRRESWNFEKLGKGITKGDRRWSGFGKHASGNLSISSTNAVVELIL